MPQTTWWALHADLLRSLAEFVGAIVTLSLVASRIPYFWSHAKLANAFIAEQGRSAYLKDALAAVSVGSQGWHDKIESLSDSLKELKDEIGELRHTQAVATRFIVDLIGHIKDGRPASDMPPIPIELRESVRAHGVFL